MTGERWGLAVLSLFACLCLVAITGAADDASGATTYIDGDWNVMGSTTISDGTWIVNGSVRVHAGVLTLDRAELVVNSPTMQQCILWVNRTAGLQAGRSTVRGGDYGLRMEIWGDTTLDNTTVDRVDKNYYRYAILHYWGRMVMDHCRVNDSYRAVTSNSTLVVRRCEITNFSSTGVYWTYSAPATVVTSLLVDGTTLRNVYQQGYGVYVYGPDQEMDRRVTVRGCTFDTMATPIYSQSFSRDGSLVIEDNDATDCSRGAYINNAGRAVRLSGNTWSVSNSYGGVELSVSDSVGPSVDNETVTSGAYGIYVSSSTAEVSLWDVDISGCRFGIYASYCEVNVHSSRVRATDYEFYVSGSGFIHIFDSDHTYSAMVTNYAGHVSEPVVLNITALTWQEGTDITTGVVYFENETAYIMDVLELRDPAPVSLPTWLKTYNENITMDRARANYSKDDWPFYSDWITLDASKRLPLTIWDDFTPELNVTRPSDGDMFDTNTLTLKGQFVERGVGLGYVRVGYQGSHWAPAQVFPEEGRWQIRLEALPDGLLNFTVNITDKAGNKLLVDLRNITVDTRWPFIQVIAPSKYVRTSAVELVARTEPGAQAFVNYRRVEVMPDGMFSTMLAFTNLDNDVHIRVVDRVGHENYTIRKVYYDTDPPSVELEQPKDAIWTTAEEVTVSGFTELDAEVEVNGVPAVLDMGKFSVDVPLTGGINVIYVNVTDKAGNRVSLSRTLHVDRAPPALVITAPREGLVTTKDRVTITGTISDESAVTLLVDGFPADVADGKWSKAVLLEEGDNQFDITATDGAGNVVRLFRNVRMDTTPPDYEATLQVAGTTYGAGAGTVITQEAMARLSVVPQESCTVRISAGSPYENVSTTLTLDLLLEPGTNTYHVHVWDAIGNKAGVVTFTLVSDSVLPLLELTTPEDMERVRRPQVVVSGTTEPGCELMVNGIPAPVLADGTFAVLVPLEDEGANTITVVATDGAGNTVTRSRQVVLEEPEEDGLSTGAGMALGLVGGLVGGLVMALVIVTLMQRRQRRMGEEEKALQAWQASGEGPRGSSPPPQAEAPATGEVESQEDAWEPM